MSLHADLLSQSCSLVNRERRRPRQASLRRAVSSAYYGLFHLLIHEASRYLVSDLPMRQLVGRAFVHAEMNKASRMFSGGVLPKRLEAVSGGQNIPKPLRDVAQAFVDLQQARHEADYNLAKSYSRAEAQALIDQAAQAFQDWAAVRNHALAKLYLLSLLLNDRLERVR